ncbi:MAG: sigma-70 family RNA polymerase sigma factor [Planctomycetales bacterium]|nr:sigma-70 family RNA polymerase sigma factor [Planctomycetales bacterium]
MALSEIDRSLLARCLAAEEGAWEEFVDRYVALITHVVSSLAKQRENLPVAQIPDCWFDDIVADVFLELLEQDFQVLRKFRGQSSLGTYLVVIARRIALNRIYELQRQPTAPLTREDFAVDGKMPDFENSEEVRVLLEKLPSQQATLIRLYHLEHCSYSEIGARLGIPENSIGPLLSQARERFRRLRA